MNELPKTKGPLTDEERAEKKGLFLKNFKNNGHALVASAKAANITPRTVYAWMKLDEAFRESIEEVKQPSEQSKLNRFFKIAKKHHTLSALSKELKEEPHDLIRLLGKVGIALQVKEILKTNNILKQEETLEKMEACVLQEDEPIKPSAQVALLKTLWDTRQKHIVANYDDPA